CLLTFPLNDVSVFAPDFTLVQVIYSRNPVRSTAGQTLTLKCTVKYTKEQCGSPLASWCLPKEHCQLLADSDRYLIYTNETEIETGFRQRDVFITFKQLSVNDTEFYNCMAKCLKTGASAVGHRINLTITDFMSKWKGLVDQCILFSIF
uniref:Ig-like domain-containing protein n=1 Tax=Electrophorus electricus TaxID=8005 RepID=A0A4W4FJA6_ELEEL